MNAMHRLRKVAAEHSFRKLAFLAIAAALCVGACSASTEDKGEQLLRAVVNGQSDRVQALLQDPGVDVNQLVGPKGMHALFMASGAGNAGLVRMLLENGAEPDLQTGQGFSALGISSSYGHAQVIEILLEYGADVNRRFGPGGTWGTALHYAAADGHAGAVRVLIRSGADPFVRDGENRRPVDRATTLEVRKLLLELQEGLEKGFRMAEEFINSTCADLTRRYNGAEDDKTQVMTVLGAAGYHFAAVIWDYIPECATHRYENVSAFSDGMIAHCAEHAGENMRTALSTFACGGQLPSR